LSYMDGVRWGKGGIVAENNELGRLKEGGRLEAESAETSQEA